MCYNNAYKKTEYEWQRIEWFRKVSEIRNATT